MTGKPENQLAKIDHIVVLMLENRSFDNMLGWLYDPENPPPFDCVPRGQPFDGVSGKHLTNPIPPEAQTDGYREIAVRRGFSPTAPTPDPGEGYAHTNRELWNSVLPEECSCPPFREPHNLPAGSVEAPPMTGFVTDWYYTLKCSHDQVKRDTRSLATIMDCFTPRTVPVLSALANRYAVCDQYFCSVPTQTLANRSFALAATSSGIVDNEPYTNWLGNKVPTVLNLMSAAHRPGLSWRVYFDIETVLPVSWVILPSLRRYLFTNFSAMDRFYSDAAAGTLPSFSFVEPRLLFNHNDQHPPYSVIPGEKLIRDMYEALVSGPAWPRTLFIITYDEHGGCYDHVPPPAAVPPTAAAPVGQFGFRFDRLGVRVPAVLISPYIEPGTVFRAEQPLDHTSVVKTITTRFGLSDLTARDAAAVDFGGALTLHEPRIDRPTIPQPATVLTMASAANGVPVTELQKTLLRLVAAQLGLQLPPLKYAAQASDLLRDVRRRFLRGPWA